MQMFKFNLRSVVVAVGAVVLGASVQSQAAVTITIGNVFTPAGSTVSVGVFASSESTDIMSGFNLPMDLNNDGVNASLPAGFTQAATAFTNAIYANTGLDANASSNFINADFIGTGSGVNVQLSSTPTKLFDLVFNVGPSVPVGTVLPMKIFIPGSPLSTLFNIAPPGTVVTSPTTNTPAAGSITVTPEPATIGLLLVAGAPLLRRSRRTIA